MFPGGHRNRLRLLAQHKHDLHTACRARIASLENYPAQFITLCEWSGGRRFAWVLLNEVFRGNGIDRSCCQIPHHSSRRKEDIQYKIVTYAIGVIYVPEEVCTP